VLDKIPDAAVLRNYTPMNPHNPGSLDVSFDSGKRLSASALSRQQENSSVSIGIGPRQTWPEACLHDLVLQRAREMPSATAILTPSESLTYAGLEERSRAWTACLLERGVRPGQLIGIAFERTADMICAMLGILRAGCAYVPLDPAYPSSHLALIIEDTRMACIAASKKLRLPLDSSLLVHCGVMPASSPAGHVDQDVPPSATAYVIYTSGSSGRPKGVRILHRNVVNLVFWAQSRYSREELACTLAGTSICFDLSVFEIFVSLAAGGSIFLLRDTLALADAGDQVPVTLINTVPSVMRELVRLSGVPPSVRTINLAGEPLDSNLVKQLYRTTRVSRVVNLYAPSETTTYSTIAEITSLDEPPSIGKPIANTSILLLDCDLCPVPTGAEGEIYIAGEGVAAGYLARTDLTSSRFIENPFHGLGSPMYKTGDLGRWRANGELEYIGRMDDQVKVRGYRIEPAEIESALLSQPDITDAAVVAHDYGYNDRRLVAYIVFAPDTSPDTGALAKRLRDRLPDYMVPTVWKVLDHLPRLANGKMDRAALKSRHVEAAPVAAPAISDLVESIRQVFSQVLQIQSPPDMDFFAAGGDSLLAMRLVAELRVRMNSRLRLSDVLRFPSPVKLAERIRQLPADGHNSASAAMPQLPVRADRLELTASQRQLWVFQKLFPHSPVQNLGVTLHWKGAFEKAQVIKALEGMAWQHDPLRTRGISMESGKPEFIIAGNAMPSLLELDARGMSPEDLDDMVKKEICRPFDLDTGLFWRVLLLRRAAHEHDLIIVFHHLLIDAASIEIFLSGLKEKLESGSGQGAASMSGAYAAVARADAELASTRGPEDMEYWRSVLQNPGNTLLGFDDFLSGALGHFKSSRRRQPVPSEAVTTAIQYCRKHAVTPYVLLLALFVRLVARYTGSRDVMVGSPFSLRESLASGEVLGFMVNSLPLRVRMAREESFEETVRRINTMIQDAQEHKFCSAAQLQTEIAGGNSYTGRPLFPIIFGLRSPVSFHWSLPQTGIDVEEVFTGYAEPDLDLQVLWSAGGEASACLDYRPSLMEESVAEWFLNQFVSSIKALAGS
jgi:amino acid adenylation domain-containing protein